MTTGEMLDLLARVGMPCLRRLDSGAWSANIEFPAPTGVTVKVASDYNHPTHESALLQLIVRVQGMYSFGDDAAKKAIASLAGTVADTN